MIIQVGEKIHVIHRQFFDGDAKRHFIGTIEGSEGNLIRVNGYLFANDNTTNEFARKGGMRTRLISIDEGIILNVLPNTVNIERITYEYKNSGEILVTDGSSWHMDLSHL